MRAPVRPEFRRHCAGSNSSRVLPSSSTQNSSSGTAQSRNGPAPRVLIPLAAALPATAFGSNSHIFTGWLVCSAILPALSPKPQKKSPRTLPRTRAPGLTDVSFSLFKSFAITERWKIEARGEFFNVLNTVNYNAPNATFTPNAAGQNVNANFGRILSSLEARRSQVGLRMTF